MARAAAPTGTSSTSGRPRRRTSRCVAPDIYDRDLKVYAQQLDHYARPDNALFVPENGNAAEYSRFLWLALGKGAIGWAPFGMDATGYSNFPLGAKQLDTETIEAFASKYRLLAPIARDWARLAFEHPATGFAKPADGADQSAVLGRWKVTAMYGMWEFGERDWTWIEMPPQPEQGPPRRRRRDRPARARRVPHRRVRRPHSLRARSRRRRATTSQFLDVEEGTFDNGRWVMQRRWNGDQTDYGLNLTPAGPAQGAHGDLSMKFAATFACAG